MNYEGLKKDLTTESERIILALMRGHHLSDKELEIAKQKVHAMNVELKNRM